MAFNSFHPGAHKYHSAIENYKIENARKTRAAEWIKENDHAMIVDFLLNARRNVFLSNLYENYLDYGALTENQCECVRKAIAKQNEWQTAAAEKAATTEYFGEIGKRQDFVLTVTFHTGFESEYGFVNVIGFINENGNVFIYKGSSRPKIIQKGDSVSFKATIKEHKEREGVKQTILARPTWK